MSKWNRITYLPAKPMGPQGTPLTACPAHRALSREAAREGMVLLKNDGVLPLPVGAKVALFGKGTFDYVKGGGGSGDVTVPYVLSLADGFARLSDRATAFGGTNDYYRAFVESAYRAGGVPGMIEEPELPDALADRARAFADTAVVSISRFSGEGWDRKTPLDPYEKHAGVDQRLIDCANRLFPNGDYRLTDAEEAMLRKVCARFDRVVIVLNVGSAFDTARFKNDSSISAVLLGWQAGLEGGLAEAELLLGLDNPSGKLSDTLANALEDYPSSAGFYASDDYVDYTEDIYVGYRYFETVPGAADKVTYPFGYGLSYTRFEFSPFEGCREDEQIVLRGRVTNLGSRPGKEVVQAYYEAPQGLLGKPRLQLAAYRKTRLLQPGETQVIELRFPCAQMASYDDLGKVWPHAWLLEKGDYRFCVGASVRDLAQVEYVYTLENDRILCPTQALMTPTALKARMRADGSFETLPTMDAPARDNVLGDLPDERMEGAEPAHRSLDHLMRFTKNERPQLIDVWEGRMTLDAFVSALPDDALAWLLGGQPNTGAANTYGYGNLPEYGVPNAMTADGPAGLRFLPETEVQTTAFPCATLLACTWNPEVCEAVGRAAAEEVKENNIGVWLAPAINIHRNPLCGRNFEYYSEDPYLTAMQAGALVRGVQSRGVAATIKHFALNNKETNRKDSDSRASERAIREIYLRAFEWIVRDANPWSIMTSYNLINGHRASENTDMLRGILRDEWHYDGMVTTDWWTRGENYLEVAAGNDMKMGTGFPDRLLDALDRGALRREEMEQAAKHILGLILRLD